MLWVWSLTGRLTVLLTASNNNYNPQLSEINKKVKRLENINGIVPRKPKNIGKVINHFYTLDWALNAFSMKLANLKSFSDIPPKSWVVNKISTLL